MSELVYGQVTAISAKPAGNRGGMAYNIKVRYADGGEDWFGTGFEPLQFGKDSMIEFDANYGDKYNDAVKGSIQVIEYVAPAQQGNGNGQGRQGGGQQRNGGNSSGQSGNSRGRSNSNGGSNQGGGRGQQSQSNGRSQQGQAPQQHGAQQQQQRQQPQRQQAPAQRPQQSGGLSKDGYWEARQAADVNKDVRIGSMACLNTALVMVDSILLNKAMTLPTKKDQKFDAYMALAFKIADELELRVQAKGDGTYGAMLPPTDAGDDGYQNSSDGGQTYEDDIPQ
jgi:hypothetical protein